MELGRPVAALAARTASFVEYVRGASGLPGEVYDLAAALLASSEGLACWPT